jgi:hypothetical protein
MLQLFLYTVGGHAYCTWLILMFDIYFQLQITELTLTNLSADGYSMSLSGWTMHSLRPYLCLPVFLYGLLVVCLSTVQ